MEKSMSRRFDPNTAQVLFWGSDWSGHPTSAVHLARGLMRLGYEVYWVNSIGMRSPRLSFSDADRIRRKVTDSAVKALTARGRGASSSVSLTEGPRPTGELHPFVIPFYRNPAARPLNRKLLSAQLRRAFGSSLGRGKDLVLITTFPNSVDFVDAFSPVSKVYYVMDDFSTFPGVDHAAMTRFEAELFPAVDGAVFAAENVLQQYRRTAYTTPCRLLTHGVDIDHFRSALHPHPVPEALAGRKGAVIGYVGLLDERIDQSLIVQIAERFSDCTLLLVGRPTVPVERLAAIPNVILQGAAAYEDLPAYLSHFDVALMPYVRSELTEGLNPLKMREYLAAGRKVVATRLPAVVEYEGVVRTAENRESFLDAVADALSSETDSSAVSDAVSPTDGWLHKASELLDFCGQVAR